jgi:hypothetical protein
MLIYFFIFDAMNNKELNYQFFNSLFNGDFKWIYYNECQKCFEKHYVPLGSWKFYPINNKIGYINEEGQWDPFNRINTHPNVTKYLYEQCIRNNPNMFIEFENPKYYKDNVKKMWEYLDNNFDIFFTKKITTEHYIEIHKRLKKSWINGIITSIAVILSLRSAFGEISDIKFTYEYGNKDDMDGFDLTFNDNKSIQIKSGHYLNLRDKFLVRGSQNNLEYTTNYYGYADVNSKQEKTEVIIFENVRSKFEPEPHLNEIYMPSDLVIYYKTQSMETPQLLKLIYETCSDNHISFTFITALDGLKENKIEDVINDGERIIKIALVNLEDENLPTMLSTFYNNFIKSL